MASVASARLLEFHSLSSISGIYTVLFITSIAVMTWRRKTKSLSRVLLLATCLLFLCATVHFALEFDNAYRTLVSTINRFLERGTTVPQMINPESHDPLGTETHQLFGADTIFLTTDFIANLVMVRDETALIAALTLCRYIVWA